MRPELAEPNEQLPVPLRLMAKYERLIEVKTTNGSVRTPFFLPRNELEVAKEQQEDWRIHRVHLLCYRSSRL